MFSTEEEGWIAVVGVFSLFMHVGIAFRVLRWMW